MIRRLLLLLALLSGEPFFAQFSSGALSGEIRDESGAVVTAAPVVARQSGTGFTRTTYSDSVGQYSLPQLPPGEYSITVRKSGFGAATLEGVRVEVDRPARASLVLKVGAGHDVVTVHAAGSLLQTGAAAESFFAGTRLTEELPLDGRNIVSLVTLGPGPVPRQFNGFGHDVINDKQAARGAVALNSPVNGARSTMNSYILDGEYDTDRNTYSIAVIPPLESVQEFQLQTSGAAAEFAQSGGGVVDLITRSGTQVIHGNLFEFLRNEATDAHGYFDDPTLPRPIFRQNQFGGSLGGPVPRVKDTFFFASYEGLRGDEAKATVHLVPDAALRTGNFAGRNAIFDPQTYNAVTNTRSPFPDNVIPANRIDPIARAFLQTYEPLPNQPDNGVSNYLDSTPSQNDNDSGSLRVDRQFRGGNTLFARYTLNDDRAVQAGFFPQRANTEDLLAQQAGLGFTHAGSVWLNDVRLSFTRLRVADLPGSSTGLPVFAVTDFDVATDSDLIPQIQRDNTWAASEAFSLTRGRHTLRAGFQFVHFQLNYLASLFPRGQFIFNGTYTSNLSSPDTGDAFADFLLGFAQSTQRNGSAQAYLRQNSYAAYVHDEWRLASRITVTAGLRYEYVSPYSDARHQLLNLDYSQLPLAPSLTPVSDAGQPNRLNFSPRLGLAWRLPKELIFRAAYGIFYSPEIATEAYDLVRNNLVNVINQTNGPVPVLTLANGFPANSTLGLPSYFGLDPTAATPYLQQWNASVQRQFHGVLLDVSYVGTKGTHLGRFRTFNTPTHVETGEDLAPRPGVLQTLRTFPSLGPIIQRQHIANSSYNSLQIKSEKRLSGGLTFLASFVWSKSIDDADTIIPGLGDSFGAQDERNLRLERGLSDFNVGRRLSIGFVDNLPSPHVLRPLLFHWSISGVFTAQDGTPENPVYFGTDFANSGTPNRPNVVPGQSLNLPASQRTAQQWFNVNAFSNPAPFTFGDAGRNILPTPGTEVFDLALHRRFALSERAGLQVRLESFNLLNHPNWGIPGQYPDFGPFFGKIFATGDPRRFQFALKLEF